MTSFTWASGLSVVVVVGTLAACTSEEVPVTQEAETPPAAAVQTQTSAEEQTIRESVDQGQAENEQEGESESTDQSQSGVQPAPIAVNGNPAQPAAAAESNADESGQVTFQQVCSGCHDYRTATIVRRSDDEWRSVIIEMLDMGADATDAQAAMIYNYLTQYFGQ